MPQMTEKVRLITAVSAIAVSFSVFTTALIGWHYESKINTLQTQQSRHISQMKRAHKKELVENQQILDRLNEISMICKGR